MILQYVWDQGWVTWQEAAELFRVTPFQATRLLQELFKKGKLTRLGHEKRTRYQQNS
jgi:ATP-dependent DNA helicase RecG